MATGELSNSETARLQVRQALMEHDAVVCIVQLTGQLFANIQIPRTLWFLFKSHGGGHGFRKRRGEILFIDGRKLGALIPGSRKQKELTHEKIEGVAAFRIEDSPLNSPAPLPSQCLGFDFPIVDC